MSDSNSSSLPEWELASEYPSLESKELLQDRQRLDELLAKMTIDSNTIESGISTISRPPRELLESLIPPAHSLFKHALEAETLLSNLYVRANCELSVDGSHAAARQIISDLQSLGAKVNQLYVPLSHLTLLFPEDLLNAYLSDPVVATARFAVSYDRAHLKDTRLPIREEKLIEALSVDGPTAWGNVYTNVSSTATCSVQKGEGTEVLGLAAASGLLQSGDSLVRRSAWDGIHSTWTTHQEVAAASLNALSGWRLEIGRRRSHTRPVHFLDEALFSNRMSRATLETLIEVARESRAIGQRALRSVAKALSLPALHPSDLYAPPPAHIKKDAAATLSFDAAIESISQAFGGISPELAQFVEMMVDRKWIEARVLPRKRPGAYCTVFAKSRNPRVYMTFLGGMRDVKTLAHELGHAFHDWAMRDLPQAQRNYPMAVAETASNFAEMIVADYLEQSAASKADIAVGLWQSIQDGATYTLNIPTRFEFESEFYASRAERSFNPDDLKALITKSWNAWFGDVLTRSDDMFWANKMHFHIAGQCFYNFPYLFGYLFSLGVYAQRERMGASFYSSYVSLLRDTGRMTVEELAKRHLQVDLQSPQFWRESFTIFDRKVSQFEAIV